MDMTTMMLVGALAVLSVFYVIRRRSRLGQEED